MAQAKIWTQEFLGMGMTNFFYFMSQYILIASLPVFIMDDLGKGQWEAGMAMTCFQIGTVACRPLAGRIIDGVNKQKLLFLASSCILPGDGGLLLHLKPSHGVGPPAGAWYRLCPGHHGVCHHGGPGAAEEPEGGRHRLFCGEREPGHGHRAPGGTSDY